MFKLGKSLNLMKEKWWAVAESNHGHEDFQSSALPTELTALTGHKSYIKFFFIVKKARCFFAE